MKKENFWALLSLLIVVILSGLRHQFYWWPAQHLSTYPGDIWYVYDHYVSKGFPFPVEYPSLMRVFVQLVNTVTIRPYSKYLWATIYFLLPFAIGTTMMLSSVLKKQKFPMRNLYQYWIFAPSFIICAITNYDLFAVFTIVLGLYLAQSGKRVVGAICLGVGTAFKVFPFFFLPLILLLCKEKKEITKVLGGFFGIWLAINFPYIIGDSNGIRGWLEPYLWQSKHNFAKGPGDGSIWWPLYMLLGNGSISIFFTLAGITQLTAKALSTKNFEENLWEWGRGIALVFLLFDRVYSPQYHLYLLPFLAVSREKINNLVFYAMELPNIMVILFLYYLREHPVCMFPLTVIKYIALIIFFMQFYKNVVINKNKAPGIVNAPISSESSSISPPSFLN